MHVISEQQLASLIHEVASTYIWQFLAGVFQYDREKGEPDFTAQWENLTEQISGDIQKDLRFHFKDITTAHQAEQKLDAILTLVRDELRRRTEVGKTDERICTSESWDRWLERMQDDGYGEHDNPHICVWCGVERDPNWNVYCQPCHARNW